MKDSLRASLLKLIESLKEQGLNLTSDSASTTLTYPEHPEVVIHITIGGLMYDDVEDSGLH